MNFLNQLFCDGETKIHFQHDKENVLQIPSSFKSNTILILISISKNEEIISLYYRFFPENISAVHYLNFVKKFLINPSYRSTYLHKDYPKWDEILDRFSSSIHPQCKEMIDNLNQKETVKFNDLVKLKTFGKDRFSTMNMQTLKEEITHSDYLFISNESENEMVALSSLRWVARGLLPQHALYKARAEAVIEKNKNSHK